MGFVETWKDSSGTDLFEQSRQDCTIEFNDLFAEIDINDYFTRLADNSDNDELTADCDAILEKMNQLFISQFYIDLADPNATQDYPAGLTTNCPEILHTIL